VKRRAHIADAESLRLEAQARVLRDDHRVERGDVVADEVVEVVAGAAAVQPPSRLEPVGTKCHHERRLKHHRLLEMQLVQLPPALGISRQNDRNAVQVPG